MVACRPTGLVTHAVVGPGARCPRWSPSRPAPGQLRAASVRRGSQDGRKAGDPWRRSSGLASSSSSQRHLQAADGLSAAAILLGWGGDFGVSSLLRRRFGRGGWIGVGGTRWRGRAGRAGRAGRDGKRVAIGCVGVAGLSRRVTKRDAASRPWPTKLSSPLRDSSLAIGFGRSCGMRVDGGSGLLGSWASLR